MRRLLLLGSLLCCLCLGSCQCSDKPEVGPVESASAATVLVGPVAA